MTEDQKRQAYQAASLQLGELLRDNQDPVTAMATFAAVLHEALPQSSWTGFYRVVAPELLRVGPYQGPIGCLEIPFERGVCGAAARQRRTVIADDVQSFPGHIACDASAKSEIVVPVFDASQNLVAVLDIDSRQPAAFDEVDRAELELLLENSRQQFSSAGVPESNGYPGSAELVEPVDPAATAEPPTPPDNPGVSGNGAGAK
jgi:GAF domain-containing protein